MSESRPTRVIVKQYVRIDDNARLAALCRLTQIKTQPDDADEAALIRDLAASS